MRQPENSLPQPPSAAGACADGTGAVRPALSVPWIGLTVTAAALLVWCVPTLARHLEYDRLQIQSGQYWRLLTWHLCHWSWEHLAWDLSAFAALALVCEQLPRRRLLAALGLCTAFSAAALWSLQPQLLQCRGLSAWGSTLFGILVAATYDRGKRQNAARTVAGAALLLFLLKVMFESGTTRTFFVDSAASGFVSVPLLHVLGLAAGVGCWCLASCSTAGGLPVSYTPTAFTAPRRPMTPVKA